MADGFNESLVSFEAFQTIDAQVHVQLIGIYQFDQMLFGDR